MSENEDITPTVYVAIGVPGCGKSTWWKEAIHSGLIAETETLCISMDTIREELTGNVEDQSKNHIVAKIADSNLKSAVAHKIPVIYWDNTSASPKYRKSVTKVAHAAGYQTVGVFFNYPLDVIKDRNASRERVVPEHVLDRMYAALKQNPPKLEEGFDNIITLTIDE